MCLVKHKVRTFTSEAHLSGFVYFIQQGHSGPVKIGYTASDDPEERLSSLQTGNPEQLYLIGFIRAGSLELESYLHDSFRKHWIRAEWFHPCVRLLNLAVRGPSLPWCNRCGLHPVIEVSNRRCMGCRARPDALSFSNYSAGQNASEKQRRRLQASPSPL